MCVALAFLGVGLMCVELELVHGSGGSWGVDSDSARDSVAFWMKVAVSASTLVLLCVLARRYGTEVSLRQLRGELPPGATVLSTPSLRRVMLLELLLCALHVPPGVDGVFFVPAGGAVASGGDVDGAVSHKYHLDVLGTLMWVRLYLLASLVRNHSGYYSQQVAYVAALNNVEAQSAAFHFKLMFRDNPLWLLGPLGATTLLATTLATQAAERAHNAALASHWQCLWLVICTVSTVG